MSLFQCENCGCCENTALSYQGIGLHMTEYYDWTGIEDRRGQKLCSECAPEKTSEGNDSGLGYWHDHFPKRLLPMGMFKTNRVGNLEHIETGEEDYRKYELK